MKRIFYFLFPVVYVVSTLFAQQSTYDFLRIDAGARAAALNGSFTSMRDDPNVIFYNPASLGTLSGPKLSAGYMSHLMDVNSGTLSYGQYINGVGNIGAGVTYINYGAFDRTDDELNVIGTFTPSELAFVAGIAGNYDDDILIGINAKLIYSVLAEYSSSALAVDLGFLYEIPSENITIGGSVLNLGKQLTTYAGVNESLPLDIKIGITKRPEHLPVYLNFNFHRLNESGDKFLDRFSNFTVGAEFLMSESVRLRIGYNNKQRKELKMGTSAGLAGFSMGGGLILRNYLIDYAFNSYGKIGGLHRISFGINL